MQTKRCTNTNHVGDRELSTTGFNKRAKSKDGLNSWCRKCCSTDSRHRREKEAAESGRQIKTNRPYRSRDTPNPIKYPRYIPSTAEGKIKLQLRVIRQRSRKLGIPFNVTLEELLPLPTHCPDLGLELVYFSKKGYVPCRATVDKIVPGLGYVPGNVRIISHQANVMKQDASLDQLKHIARQWLALVDRLQQSVEQ